MAKKYVIEFSEKEFFELAALIKDCYNKLFFVERNAVKDFKKFTKSFHKDVFKKIVRFDNMFDNLIFKEKIGK